MFFLPAIIASLGVAQAAVVTVTQHVHEDAIVSVEGVLYVENGETQTTFITEGAATPTSVSNQVSTTVIAVAAASDSSVDTADLEKALTTASASASSSSGSQTTLAPSTASAVASTSSAVASTSSAVASTSSAVASTSSAVASTSSAVASTSSPVASSSTAVASTSSAASSTVPSSSSATSASASASASSTSTFQNDMVDGHNTKRALHESTSSLEWDDTLATYAQNYADEYDCSGSLTHSGGPYGENLALGYDDQGTIDAWYDEISKYDWSNPGYSESTGHFTQVVWKSTTKVGCGYKQCSGSTGKYVICSYSSAGNVIGYFSENVLSLL